MKLKPCFSSYLPCAHLFSWAAVLLLLLTSCHQEFVGVDDLEVTLARNAELCNEDGDSVDFPLEIYTSGVDDADYAVNVETGPYQSTDCLCKIRTYQFYFTGVNPEWPITITDMDGNPVALDIVVDGESGKAIVTILNPELLLDQDLTVLITFGNGDGELTPTLVQAGGLCIIENVIIDQGIPLGLQAPLILFDSSGSSNGGSMRKAYIPTSIGGAPY